MRLLKWLKHLKLYHNDICSAGKKQVNIQGSVNIYNNNITQPHLFVDIKWEDKQDKTSRNTKMLKE